MSVVLDASTALAWCFEDEHTAAAEAVLAAVLAGGAIVPNLWHLEVANVLLVAERRGRTTRADTARYLALLDALPLDTLEAVPPVAEVLAVARAHQLSAYDGVYLVTAMQHGYPLATQDSGLRIAARACGVALA